jgi:hypothetical protein
MSDAQPQPAAVLAFKRRADAPRHPQPRTLMERIYAAGSLAVAADDRATRAAAAMMQAFGLIVIDEVQADGALRRLAAGEARLASAHPWRLAKPPFCGESGLPDASGAFASR